MAPPAAWHGTEIEINDLLTILRRDCAECVIAMRVLEGFGLCVTHRAMLDSQRFLDGLLVERERRYELIGQEFTDGSSGRLG